MRILAVDAATTTGFAQWSTGDDWPTYGSVKFDAEELGARAAQFVDWLLPTISAQETTDIAIEPPVPIMSGNTNDDAQTWLRGMYWRTHEIAHRRRIKVWGVYESSWRSAFMGVTRAPKDVPKHKRRDWLKRRCIQECNARGYSPKDDNAADSLGILHYVRAMSDESYLVKNQVQLTEVAA